jgi:hypothetical protein
VGYLEIRNIFLMDLYNKLLDVFEVFSLESSNT